MPFHQRPAVLQRSNEVLFLIFGELDDAALACFAITCKDLLARAIAKPEFLDRLKPSHCARANCRIITLGEFMRSEDFDALHGEPFTEQEKAAIDSYVDGIATEDPEGAEYTRSSKSIPRM